MEISNKSPKFTLKKVLRILSLLCFVFVFCPSFIVSCSGQEVKVNVFTAVGGLSSYGETVVEPHPIMLICFIIPIAMLILLFRKKSNDKQAAVSILILAAIDIVLECLFKAKVKEIAENNFCTYETTSWYVINLICLALVILITVLIIVGKAYLETDVGSLILAKGSQGSLGQTASVTDHTPKFCHICGTALDPGAAFCKSCGTRVEK